MLISFQDHYHHHHHQISAYCQLIFVTLSVIIIHSIFRIIIVVIIFVISHIFSSSVLRSLSIIIISFVLGSPSTVRRVWRASTHPRLAVLRFTFSFPQCCRTCLPSLNSPTFGGIALHLLLSTMLSDVPGGLGPPKSDGVAFSFSTIQSYSSSSYIQHHPFQHSYRHHVHFSGVHFQLQQYKVYEIRFSSHVR